MRGTKKRAKQRAYTSMGEFEREFFPNSFEKRMSEENKDARSLGVGLAKESLDRVRRSLAKK